MPSLARSHPPVADGRHEPATERVERFRHLYESTYGDLVGYCRRRLPPAMVDDTVADAFTVAWQRLDEVDGDVRPWLFGVAHNIIRNQRRRQVRSEALHDAIVHDLSTNRPIDSEQTVDELAALVAALHALADADAEIIRLVAWEGLEHRGIATVLGCSENAVAIRLHRARKRLRSLLDRDDRWPVGAGSGATPKGTTPLRQVMGDGAEHDPGTGTNR